MVRQSCPTIEELAAYAEGRLDLQCRDEIGVHLEHCPQCLAAIQTAGDGDDTLAASPSQPPFEANNLDCATSRVRDYQLLAKLGEGGMGAVYKALHTQLEKVVAVKILPAERMRDPAAVARFKREMKAVGRLEHPNIVGALDAGEEGGVHFLVMQYVEGLDLATLSKRLGPLPVAAACELVRQAAVGLQHAHEHGMVHRDIKPSNLMLTVCSDRIHAVSSEKPDESGHYQPLIKILDFGLALLGEAHLEGGRELTTTGQMMGTLDYMAPEQGADTHAVDIRADIYSLGATLFKLLTGEPPLSGERYNSAVKKLMALAAGEVPSVATRRGDLPSGVTAAVDRMLACRPAERFAIPQAVADSLTPHCAGADLPALALAASGDDRDTRLSSSGKPAHSLAETLSVHAASRRSTTPPHSRHRLYLSLAATATLLLLAVMFKFATRKDDVPQALRETPAGGAPQTDGPAIETGNLDPGHAEPARGERGVIEWVRSQGGTLAGTNSAAEYVIVRPGETMPSGQFDLVTVDLFGKQIRDADLARFDNLPRFTTLILNSTPIGDEGIARLGSLPELMKVYLGGTKVTNAGLANLTRYPKIAVLHAPRAVSDDGTESLLKWPGLTELQLFCPAVSDKSIEVLVQLPKLETMYLTHSGITPGGVERLRAALPRCWINTDFGVFGRSDGTEARPSEPPTPDRAVAAWAHSVGGTVGLGNTPRGYDRVGPNDEVPEGDIWLHSANLFESAATDADLARLNGLQHFTTLLLNKTIGHEGVLSLGSLPALRAVYFNGSTINDASLKELVRRYPHIRVFHAGSTKITDVGIESLRAWPDLVDLNLFELPLTDRSLDTLVGLRGLQTVALGMTRVTREGIERLRKALPNCTVHSHYGKFIPASIEGQASLRFDGFDDYVDLPGLKCDVSQPLTIEASVRREPPLSGYGHLVSNSKMVDGPPGVDLCWNRDHGWSLLLKTDKVRSTACPEPASAPAHVAGVWDGKELRLYFDGKLVSSRPCEAGPVDVSAAGHFVIGATQTLDGRFRSFFFKGAVDEVRISRVARYQADYEPVARFEPDEHTLGLYHCDEGTGEVLRDSSGKGRDGKIVGATWIGNGAQ